jgi:hypothetical protein
MIDISEYIPYQHEHTIKIKTLYPRNDITNARNRKECPIHSVVSYWAFVLFENLEYWCDDNDYSDIRIEYHACFNSRTFLHEISWFIIFPSEEILTHFKLSDIIWGDAIDI